GTKPGRIQIEEAGLPVTEIPVQVSIWSASNPDEDPGPLGDIRRQLSDRFDFTVNVERPTDAWVINQILDGAISNNVNNKVSKRVKEFIEAEKAMDRFEPSQEIRQLLASLYVDYCIESLRSIEAALLGIKIRGALLKRNPSIDDVIFITRYTLRHRMAIKDVNSILKNLEQRKNVLKKTPSPAEIQTQTNDKISVLSKAPETNKEQNKKEWRFDILKNIIKRLNKNINLAGRRKCNNIISNPDPKNIDMKAPPQKALSISELDIKEYVKTEEELLK
ncbi:MAG: magnesium chelatase, partial [Tepidanaerobacteraceae bacterium]|nr:magnesium chelatase [Tepidanaerobacteraceae bacterium]